MAAPPRLKKARPDHGGRQLLELDKESFEANRRPRRTYISGWLDPELSRDGPPGDDVPTQLGVEPALAAAAA